MRNKVKSKLHKDLRPTITMGAVPAFLYEIGVSYHDYGTISEKDSKVKLFDYYACDRITTEQKQKISEVVPLAQFKYHGQAYAPEIKNVSVWIPKTMYYRSLDNE